MSESPSTPEYEVIIIGCGITGAAIGNLLGKYGIRAAVIDRKVQADTALTPLVLDTESSLILDKIDLLQEVRAKAFPVRGMRLIDAYGTTHHELQQDRFHSEEYFPYQMTISHTDLATILRSGLDRYRSVDVVDGIEAIGLDAESHGVQLKVQDVRAEETFAVQAKCLIACDGQDSFVRNALNIGLQEFGGEESWFVAETYADDVLNARDFLACLCNAEHPVTVIPYGHGRYQWRLQFDPDLDQIDEDYFLTFLERWINTDKLSIVKTSVCEVQPYMTNEWRRNGVFLLGDAAHKLPASMNLDCSLALQDAWNLGWKLAMVLNELADESLLDSYVQERRSVMKGVTTQAPLFRQAIRGGKVDLPSLKPDYGEGFTAKGQAITVGQLFSNPKVHKCNGELVQLHDVMGDHFTVLGLNKNPVDYISEHAEWQGLWDSLGTQFVWIIEPGVTMCFSGDNFTTLKDSEGKITDWFRKQKAEFVILRPDRYVYGVYYRDLSKAERHLIPEFSIH